MARAPLLAWHKSFSGSYAADEKSAKNNGGTAFSKRYPFMVPSNPELGGWSGVFPSLTLCIGVGVSKLEDNSCLLQPDGVFIWTEQTMNKLGEGRDKQMRFIFQMIKFFYLMLMGGDAVVSGVPFQQYLGPLGKAV